jgi:hypothetical protein
VSSLSVSVFGLIWLSIRGIVFVIVSDWEPYLGSLFGVGVCGVIVLVFVFVTSERAVIGFSRFLFFLYIVLFSSLLKMYHNNHAAFWSASPVTIALPPHAFCTRCI